MPKLFKERMDLNVLMIGLDRDIIRDTKNPTFRRQKAYADEVSSLSFIVYTPKDPKGKNHSAISDGNISVFPTNSTNKLTYFFDTLKIGKEIVREKGIDIVVTQDPLATGLCGYLLKRKFGIVWVSHVHGDYIDNPHWLRESPKNRLLNIFGKYLMKRADGLRVVSRLISNKLKSKKYGLNPNAVIHATPSVELDKYPEPKYSKVELKERLGFAGKKMILFVGRIEREKEIPLLLEAVRTLKDDIPLVHLIVVGRGSLLDKMKGIAGRLKLDDHVTFTGYLPMETLIDYYRLADVFVLVSYYEGTAKVLKEAAMAELPLISTSVSGSDEIVIDGKSGFLIPIGDGDVLTEKLKLLLTDDEMAEKMGNAAKKHVIDTFDFKKNVKDIVGSWEKIYNLKEN
jgi:glycosyltransferase involved in cell wall biosynthesis